jgi:hypothetical protein
MKKKTKLKVKMMTQFAGLSLAGLLFAFCTTFAASQEVSVTSERPIQMAAERLEDLYRVPITYEDTLYVNEDDFVDVTAEVRLDHDGSNPNRVLVPARRTITFPLAEAETGKMKSQSERSGAALMALENVIDSYTLAGGAGEFSAFKDSAGLHVVSRAFRDGSARSETMSPVLEMPVWITQQHQPALDVIEEICQQVSLRGRTPLDVGTVPTNLLANTPVSVNAKNTNARDVLESISEQVGAPLSWDLLCDPRGGCALNIHVRAQ